MKFLLSFQQDIYWTLYKKTDDIISSVATHPHGVISHSPGCVQQKQFENSEIYQMFPQTVGALV